MTTPRDHHRGFRRTHSPLRAFPRSPLWFRILVAVSALVGIAFWVWIAVLVGRVAERLG